MKYTLPLIVCTVLVACAGSPSGSVNPSQPVYDRSGVLGNDCDWRVTVNAHGQPVAVLTGRCLLPLPVSGARVPVRGECAFFVDAPAGDVADDAAPSPAGAEGDAPASTPVVPPDPDL